MFFYGSMSTWCPSRDRVPRVTFKLRNPPTHSGFYLFVSTFSLACSCPGHYRRSRLCHVVDTHIKGFTMCRHTEKCTRSRLVRQRIFVVCTTKAFGMCIFVCTAQITGLDGLARGARRCATYQEIRTRKIQTEPCSPCRARRHSATCAPSLLCVNWADTLQKIVGLPCVYWTGTGKGPSQFDQARPDCTCHFHVSSLSFVYRRRKSFGFFAVCIHTAKVQFSQFFVYFCFNPAFQQMIYSI
jgi:hypothetical protein